MCLMRLLRRKLVSIHRKYSPEYLSTHKIQERLAKDWTSPVYAFFEPRPAHKTATIKGQVRRWHEFRCSAPHCLSKGRNQRIVRCYLDSWDAKSTSNMLTHASICWGQDLVKKAMEERPDVKTARASLGKAEMKNGTLTATFKRLRTGKGNVTFSARQHTYEETW